MVTQGDTAPDFTAPLANGDLGSFTLSDQLSEHTPVVLAFFPGAFTSTCQHEMNTFQSRIDEVTSTGASLFGISVDTPFALNEFRDQLGLQFGLLSDSDREVVELYDVAIDSDLGIQLSNRAVFVIDDSQTITYHWVGENPGVEPDYDEVIEAIGEAA